MFQDWHEFYFMMGSAGAGLIGLLFVVVTLTSGFERQAITLGMKIYISPTALHFAAVLSISAVAMAPGLPPRATAVIFAVVAIVGLAHAVRSCLGIRAREFGTEKPHWSDFWMYGGVPAAIYLGILAASASVWAQAEWAAHAMAGLVLALLLIGIRNSWDLVTDITRRQRKDPAPTPASAPGSRRKRRP